MSLIKSLFPLYLSDSVVATTHAMFFLEAVVVTSLASTALGSTCKYIQAHAGDGCWSLAERCGISQSDLTK